MNDLKMILRFGVGWTNGRTYGHTLVVVKSLPRLKKGNEFVYFYWEKDMST